MQKCRGVTKNHAKRRDSDEKEIVALQLSFLEIIFFLQTAEAIISFQSMRALQKALPSPFVDFH